MIWDAMTLMWRESNEQARYRKIISDDEVMYQLLEKRNKYGDYQFRGFWYDLVVCSMQNYSAMTDWFFFIENMVWKLSVKSLLII